MTILTDNQRLLRAGREYLPKDLFELLKRKLPKEPPQLGQIVTVPSISTQNLEVVALHYKEPVIFLNDGEMVYHINYENHPHEVVIPD